MRERSLAAKRLVELAGPFTVKGRLLFVERNYSAPQIEQNSILST
jgi:hypothetical protein